MNKEIEQLIDSKMNELRDQIGIVFRLELYNAIENIDGIKCLRSSTVCSLLDISERTLYRRRKNNEIGFIFKNGVYWYKVEDVLKYVNEDYVDQKREELKESRRGPNGVLAHFFH
jgi:hypothetical protein